MSGSNAATLRTYQERAAAYVAGTTPAVSGPVRDWIDSTLAGLAPTARIFELGSAFGRDAAYIAARGFSVECSDAVPAFVDLLRASGVSARLFDVLADPLPGPYDLIFANAVLLHFTACEFDQVLGRLAGALAPGGRLAFSLKQGHGEEWSEAKLGAPRFFRYWQPDELPPRLAAAGFADWTIKAARTGRAHPDWLYVTARMG
jgi:SAM-dependent methyltransferase